RLRRIQSRLVALAVHVIADKPADSGASYDIGGEMLARYKSRGVHSHGIRINQNRNDARMRIFMGDYRRQCPRLHRMAGRETGPRIPRPSRALPEIAVAISFERPLTRKRALEKSI